MSRAKMPVPTEAQEQTWLFQWAVLQSGKYPELALLYHIPNGGSRHKLEAAHLRQEGVKSGVPDLCLPVARGGYHGLYVEMKRTKGGRISPQQAKWIALLKEQGYMVMVCRGWEDAAAGIKDYLDGKLHHRFSDRLFSDVLEVADGSNKN